MPLKKRNKLAKERPKRVKNKTPGITNKKGLTYSI